MKHFIFLMAALLLTGCRAKQTMVSEAVTESTIDTTKTVADTMQTVAVHIDTTKTTQKVEQATTIEFIDGGGFVSIDTAGNMAIQGVIKITRLCRAEVTQYNGVADSTDMVTSHNEQANGVSESTGKQTNTKTVSERAVRWYERPLIWIGSLCCIAILLWLIFLYIQKKH